MADKTHETKQANQAVNKQRTSASVEHAAESIASGAPGVEYALANLSLASPGQLLALQRMAGNRAVSHLIQTKLTVGAANDPYEQEADRVAEQVVSGQWSMDRHPPTVARPVQRQAAPEEEEVQTKRVSAVDSFDAGSEFESQLSAARGGGSPLPDAVRRQMEAGFGADFSGVRVHTGGEAAQLNRTVSAQAFTHGTDIYLGAGKSDLRSNEGQRLLAHELTHVLQQTGNSLSSSSPVARPRVAWRHPAVDRMIQRHSTHEHYLLGTFKPDQLADIPLIREQVKKAEADKKVKIGPKWGVTVDEDKRREVIHLIENEMGRLLAWQHKSPTKQLEEQKDKFGAQIGKVEKVDNEWQAPYVELPTTGGKVICTYGELNTLADMFGTIEDLKKTSGEVVIRMLQGVRQRVYIKLYEILKEIGAEEFHKKEQTKMPEMEAKWLHPGTTFEGAVGFTGKEATPIGRAMAVKGYENVTKMGGSTGKYGLPGGAGEFTEANASAALARNACHFAPETWYTWRRYHNEARTKATQAYGLNQSAAANRQRAQLLAPLPQAPSGEMRGPFSAALEAGQIAAQKKALLSQADQWEEKAKGLVNEALLFAGFGDHYAQDAYAAGHLIDKTKIMQWFVGWLQKEGRAKQNADWAMIRTLVEQEMTSNPQMLENVQGDLGAKLAEMNVQVQDHVLLLMWWRQKAAQGKGKAGRTLSVGEVNTARELPIRIRAMDPWALLQKLVDLGFAEKQVTKQGITNWVLKEEHVNVVKPKGSSPYKAQTKGKDLATQAQEFNYVAMGKFMDNTYVQKITNFLHDKFCSEGLQVQSGYGEDLNKIYGDAAMLTAGGQTGIKHSVTTSQWARNAIMDLITTGATQYSTGDIEKRFPNKVVVDGNALPLATWMQSLKVECEKDNGLFKKGAEQKVGKLLKTFQPSLTGEKTFSPVQKVLQQVEQQARQENYVPHAIF